MKIIGVIGYSDNSCKTVFAENELTDAITEIAHLLGYNIWDPKFPVNELSICSGLTDLGIPSLAYKFAETHGCHTIGIACSKANENPCFPVDEKIIVGNDWGDESETFLSKIDALVRIGGGKQSESEWNTFTQHNPEKPAIYRPLTRDGK